MKSKVIGINKDTNKELEETYIRDFVNIVALKIGDSLDNKEAIEELTKAVKDGYWDEQLYYYLSARNKSQKEVDEWKKSYLLEANHCLEHRKQISSLEEKVKLLTHQSGVFRIYGDNSYKTIIRLEKQLSEKNKHISPDIKDKKKQAWFKKYDGEYEIGDVFDAGVTARDEQIIDRMENLKVVFTEDQIILIKEILLKQEQ